MFLPGNCKIVLQVCEPLPVLQVHLYHFFSDSADQVNSVRLFSHVQLFATPWCPTPGNSMDCSMLGFPVHHQLLELVQTHVHRVGDAIQPSHPLLSPSPPAFNLPSIRVFSNESVLCIRWPKYWSFRFSISPSNEYSGLISFRLDWFDIALQQTLKSLLQHHSSKASILRHSAFSVVQFSHLYMTTGITSFDNAQLWM